MTTKAEEIVKGLTEVDRGAIAEADKRKYMDLHQRALDERDKAEAERDVLRQAVPLMQALCNAYQLVCDEAGKPYYKAASSYYAHAQAFLKRIQPEPDPLEELREIMEQFPNTWRFLTERDQSLPELARHGLAVKEVG